MPAASVSPSRRRGCLRYASSTKWITSRARYSSRNSRVSRKAASLPEGGSRNGGRWSPRPGGWYSDSLKLVFAGTPEFAAVALEGLLQAGHEVVLVLTRPDRPAGRGRHSPPPAGHTPGASRRPP